MTITEMYRCKGKKGYIESSPYGSSPEITGEVECLGFTDYIHINPISGEKLRVTQIAILYSVPGSVFKRTCLVNREHIKLIE